MSTVAQEASAAIAAQREALAEALVETELAAHPELEKRYGAAGRVKCQQDANYHFIYLAEALAFDNRALFADYVGWVKVMLGKRKVPAADLVAHLEGMARILRTQVPGEAGDTAAEFVEAAVRLLHAMPEDLPSLLHEGKPLSLLGHQYSQALLRGERQLASRLVLDAVGSGATVGDIYLDVFQPALYEIGRLWQVNDIGIAKEHYCTAATQLVMSQLYPRLFLSEKLGRSLVATCVLGDLHEIGARMVADFFEMAGWETFYTGANTPHAAVIEAVVEQKADVLAVSATTALHLSDVATLIAAVRSHPQCTNVKIIVGGQPFNRDPDLWRKVGADGGGVDAQEAIAVAERLLS